MKLQGMSGWKFLALICLLVVSLLLTASTEVLRMEQEFITIEQMSPDQLKIWNPLFDLWLQDVFRPTLKALNYKQDCTQCGDIYFITRFYVDSEGRVSQYEIVREEIDCRNKTTQQNDEMRQALTYNFRNWTFPPALRNRIIEARMGEVTRC
jgi:hypothetical protein